MTETLDATPQSNREPQLKVSVIVPVHNRSNALRTCLSAIVRQACGRRDCEVLICDDGSTEDLSEVIAPLMSTYSGPISYFRQPRQGAAAARNLGIAHAQGEILAFTDSDCEPDENWLSELVRPFEAPSVGLVGGLIDYHAAQHISGRCMNFLMSSALGAAGARDPRSIIHMQYYPRAGNMAVRRELAREIGGFPASSHGEDLEFSRKVLELGVSVDFVPTARVLHNEDRTVFQAFREAAKKGAARVRLAKRYGMHEFIHALPALLWLYAGLFGMVWITKPELLLPVSFPACLYILVLVILAIQGAICLRSVAAGLVVPVYAAAMHLGYGLGYLVEWAKAWCSAVCRVIERAATSSPS